MWVNKQQATEKKTKERTAEIQKIGDKILI
jgi:hypothetical protein